VYDVTNGASFENTDSWFLECNRYSSNQEMTLVLVGNKYVGEEGEGGMKNEERRIGTDQT
jgi:hypothetical protein